MRRSPLLTAVVALSACLAAPAIVCAQTDYRHPSIPDTPQGRLVEGADGNFYGTSVRGGANNSGTVFRVTPTGEVTVLYDFGILDGRPETGLLRASDGNFYGSTSRGTDYFSDKRTIFRISRNGSRTVLVRFSGLSFELLGNPSDLIEGIDGNFYGTTDGIVFSNTGRPGGGGAVFRTTLAGACTQMHRFGVPDPAPDPGNPSSPLSQAGDGTFYGTTLSGGAYRRGVIYRIPPAGGLTVLHEFNGANGAQPSGGLLHARDGNFYGTTRAGGAADKGTIFRMTPAGLVTLLYSFTGDAVGTSPTDRLMEGPDGTLYGTTADTAFQMTPSGEVSLLHTFTIAEGYKPHLGFLRSADGNFYGTAESGGEGPGTVFRMTREGDVTVITTFHNTNDGARITIDLPLANRIVSTPFRFAGWALDLAPTPTSGAGMDTIHVWAFPAAGTAPIFLGAAKYGLSRFDVQQVYGSRFASSGFDLIVRSLMPGTYTLVAYGLRTASGRFDAASGVVVNVQPAVSEPRIRIDTFGPTETVGPFATITGWAIDQGSTLNPGVDLVHVWAYPNPGSGSPPIFLGAATYGIYRPDVAQTLGPQFIQSGYSLRANGLAPGRYRLEVFARSTLSMAFSAQTREITVRESNPQMALDVPTDGSVTPPFVIAGWAVDTDAPEGTGVDAVHVWAFPPDGPPVFLGAAPYGGCRWDVGRYLGGRFTYSGYSMTIRDLPAGAWQLVVYARSALTHTFNQSRVVSVTVH